MPQYTNKKNLSASWVRAAQASNDEYDKTGWQSVTTIVDAPRAQLLKQRHDAEVIVDVSDEIFSILGSAVHRILELASEANVITEQRIVVPILGKEISMKADRIEPVNGSVPKKYIGKDYKITKVWAWKYGAKASQIAQGNAYRFGYSKELKLDIQKWYLEMLLRDWSALEKKIKGDEYPDAEVMPVEIPLWDLAYTNQYLENRVKLFLHCEGLADDELPQCTEIERWARPEKFAVKKKGGVKAVPHGLHPTRTAAQKFINLHKDSASLEIEHRPCQNIRCDDYCNVRKWCNQAQGTLREEF